MKILLLGKNGQVGWELHRALQPLGEVIALSRKDADFTKLDHLRRVVNEISPHVIVNAVAYTAVDKAENEEELASSINEKAVGVLAEQAEKLNALLVHYSTDYVFNGKSRLPYTEDDPPDPLNAYGRSKLEGEKAILRSGCKFLILRTSWVYTDRGSNFLRTILRLAKEREELGIVSDQIGAPTSALLIADTTAQILFKIYRCGGQESSGRSDDASAYASQMLSEISGVYHLTASGKGSWYDFAKHIVANLAARGADFCLNPESIKAIETEDYPLPAARPRNSVLSCAKVTNTFNVSLPHWKVGADLVLRRSSQ